MQRAELLRDVFAWAYERSCQRYLARRQSLGEPDAFRMKYRALLVQAVRDVIRNDRPGTAEEIADFAFQKIREEDMSAFAEAVQLDFDNLYDGNVARY